MSYDSWFAIFDPSLFLNLGEVRAEVGEVVCQGDRLLCCARPDQLLGEQAELLPPVEGLRVGERRARLCHLRGPQTFLSIFNRVETVYRVTATGFLEDFL